MSRFLGSLFLAAVGLLMAACSTAMLLSDYKATILYNDTAELRAECQKADSLEPENDWIGPGEAMLAHSGRYCAVHAPDGSPYGCVLRSAISTADGETLELSRVVNTQVRAADCPGGLITRPFQPQTFEPRRAWPSEYDQRGTGYVVMGYLMAAALAGVAVFLALRSRRTAKGAPV